ncbi:MAG: transglutaminase-like domain-containing protein [Thermoguttaceae bacterium]
MRLRHAFAVLALVLSVAASASAQFQAGGEAKGTKMGDATTSRWQVGVMITADGGPCTGLIGYVPMFVDWPEQQVSVVNEEVTPGVTTNYKMVEGTKVMLVNVPNLPAGQQAKAIMTFEVRRSSLVPPADTSVYSLANAKKLPRDVRPYLGPSPGIQCKAPKIKTLAKQITEGKEEAWEKVRAIYEWMGKNVSHEKSPRLGDALSVLKDHKGNTDELTFLFIALCRALDIPARTVWVPDHSFPEFYLVDDEGTGHWFPCELTGSRSFGGTNERRPVLMKGDNFRPPWSTREHQRLLTEYLTGTGGKPKAHFVRQAAAGG